MTTVTGTLKTILKNPSSVTGVMIRASRLRTNIDGVTTGEMEPVDWNPTTGTVTFDAEPGQAYLILQMQGRLESISISIPNTPSATLREVIETNYVFDPPVVLAAQQAAAESAGFARDAATSEINAESSATAAATRATQAASSATSASTSAGTATTKATAASTSATNAANSATNAANSATNAATSASTASTKATEATTTVAEIKNLFSTTTAKIGQIPKWDGTKFIWSWLDQFTTKYDTKY